MTYLIAVVSIVTIIIIIFLFTLYNDVSKDYKVEEIFILIRKLELLETYRSDEYGIVHYRLPDGLGNLEYVPEVFMINGNRVSYLYVKELLTNLLNK